MKSKKQVRYAGKKIVVINRDHGARRGTKRARAMELLFKTPTTDAAIPKLQKIGADNTFIRFAVASKLVKLVSIAAGFKKPSQSVYTPVKKAA